MLCIQKKNPLVGQFRLLNHCGFHIVGYPWKLSKWIVSIHQIVQSHKNTYAIRLDIYMKVKKKNKFIDKVSLCQEENTDLILSPSRHL